MLVGDQLARSRSRSEQKVRTIWRNLRNRSFLRKEITVFGALRLCWAFCTSLTDQAVRRRVSSPRRRARKVGPSIAGSFLRAASANCNSSMRCRNLTDNGCDTAGINPLLWGRTLNQRMIVGTSLRRIVSAMPGPVMITIVLKGRSLLLAYYVL